MDWLTNPNMLWVLSGTMLLGASSGILGSFALLRRRSLLGDALAHAALPGICLAFMIAGTKSLPVLLFGALVASLLGSFVIQAVVKHTKLKEDAALGIVLSVFFAFGIVLLTQIQHSGAGNQSGLDKFLFGQAASMIGSDVQVMAVSAAIVSLLTILLFKELKLLCFDAQYASGIGFSSRVLDGLLMILIVMIVVIGLQAVGVVLMAALLITPAAAARLWTDNLRVMVWLAGLMGVVSGIGGTFISSVGLRLPTGPLIVISASIMFAFSLIFAPKKGIIARIAWLVKTRIKVGRENVLRTMYELAEAAGTWDLAVSAERIAQRRGVESNKIMPNVRRLAREKLITLSSGKYNLTKEGLKNAYSIVRNHRLWEMFLMHENQIAADHVDRDADLIEHHLSPEIVKQLEEFLKVHSLELKLPESVHPINVG